jgi:hypothetical protein
MSNIQAPDDPDVLRKRAKHLRKVIRGVVDLKVVEDLERFIAELEARADALASSPH